MTAITQLQPHEAIWTLTNGVVASRCLHVVAELGVADHIAGETGQRRRAGRPLRRCRRLARSRPAAPGGARDLPRRVGRLRAHAVFAAAAQRRPDVDARLLAHDGSAGVLGQPRAPPRRSPTSPADAGTSCARCSMPCRAPRASSSTFPRSSQRWTSTTSGCRRWRATSSSMPSVGGRLRPHGDRHDWADDECVAILSAIRRAASSGATLLVIESVLDESRSDPRAQTLDIIMLYITGGRERTASQLTELFRRAGFSDGRVVETAASMRIVEATAV
jgi:hypothetical protein